MYCKMDARKLPTNSHIYKLSTWLQLMTQYNTQYGLLQQLDAENFQTVIVADCNPVWLSWWPLYLVDLSSSSVCQNWILNGPWHLLDVPDQRLPIIGCEQTPPSSWQFINHNHTKIIHNSLRLTADSKCTGFQFSKSGQRLIYILKYGRKLLHPHIIVNLSQVTDNINLNVD